MNETERADKIGKAACDGHPTITDHWDSLDEILQSSWIDEGMAAVRAAYEIDEIDKLVEAAEYAAKILEMYNPKDLSIKLLRAAAARVREAMGGQT